MFYVSAIRKTDLVLFAILQGCTDSTTRTTLKTSNMYSSAPFPDFKNENSPANKALVALL